MGREPYDLNRFIEDAKGLIGLVLFSCFGIGLFYYLLHDAVGIESTQSLRYSIIAGGVWALIGYWGDLLDVDIQKLLKKDLFSSKKNKK